LRCSACAPRARIAARRSPATRSQDRHDRRRVLPDYGGVQRLDELGDAERKADRRAFFGSIHSTLNHILWGDRVWLPRFSGGSYPAGRIGEDLYDDFEALQAARRAMDDDITAWAAQLDTAQLAGTLTWFSAIAQREMSRPRWLCVMQMFNHQTHHRGQVTTLLRQAGVDPGVTDLPWAPLTRDAGQRVVLGETFGL
jgi:uncharacterized damage-inducible protein DinB